MGNPQYTQFLRIIQREGIAQKQKKDSNRKESEEAKYEENEKVVIYLHKQKNILQKLLESEE